MLVYLSSMSAEYATVIGYSSVHHYRLAANRSGCCFGTEGEARHSRGWAYDRMEGGPILWKAGPMIAGARGH